MPGWLVDWLTGWLVDWLTGLTTDSLAHLLEQGLAGELHFVEQHQVSALSLRSR